MGSLRPGVKRSTTAPGFTQKPLDRQVGGDIYRDDRGYGSNERTAVASPVPSVAGSMNGHAPQQRPQPRNQGFHDYPPQFQSRQMSSDYMDEEPYPPSRQNPPLALDRDGFAMANRSVPTIDRNPNPHAPQPNPRNSEASFDDDTFGRNSSSFTGHTGSINYNSQSRSPLPQLSGHSMQLDGYTYRQQHRRSRSLSPLPQGSMYQQGRGYGRERENSFGSPRRPSGGHPELALGISLPPPPRARSPGGVRMEKGGGNSGEGENLAPVPVQTSVQMGGTEMTSAPHGRLSDFGDNGTFERRQQYVQHPRGAENFDDVDEEEVDDVDVDDRFRGPPAQFAQTPQYEVQQNPLLQQRDLGRKLVMDSDLDLPFNRGGREGSDRTPVPREQPVRMSPVTELNHARMSPVQPTFRASPNGSMQRMPPHHPDQQKGAPLSLFDGLVGSYDLPPIGEKLTMPRGAGYRSPDHGGRQVPDEDDYLAKDHPIDAEAERFGSMQRPLRGEEEEEYDDRAFFPPPPPQGNPNLYGVQRRDDMGSPFQGRVQGRVEGREGSRTPTVMDGGYGGRQTPVRDIDAYGVPRSHPTPPKDLDYGARGPSRAQLVQLDDAVITTRNPAASFSSPYSQERYGDSGPGYVTPTIPPDLPQNRRREAWEEVEPRGGSVLGGYEPQFPDPRGKGRETSPPIQMSQRSRGGSPPIQLSQRGGVRDVVDLSMSRADSPMRMNSNASVVPVSIAHSRSRSEVGDPFGNNGPASANPNRRSHSRAQSLGNLSVIPPSGPSMGGPMSPMEADFANVFFSGYLQKQNRHRRFQKRLFRLDGLLLLCLSPSTTRKTPDGAPLVRTDPLKFSGGMSLEFASCVRKWYPVPTVPGLTAPLVAVNRDGGEEGAGQHGEEGGSGIGGDVGRGQYLVPKWIIPTPQILEIRSLVPQPSPDPNTKSARTFIIRTRRRDYTLVAPSAEAFRRWTFLLCRLSNNSVNNGGEDEDFEGDGGFDGEESDDEQFTQVQGYGMGMEKLVRMGVEGLGGGDGAGPSGESSRHARRRSVASMRSSIGGSTLVGGIPPSVNLHHPSRERLATWHRALQELVQVDPDAAGMAFSVAIAPNGGGGVERGLGALVRSGVGVRRRSSVASLGGGMRGVDDVLFKYNGGQEVPPVPELPAGVRGRAASNVTTVRERESPVEGRGGYGGAGDVGSIHSGADGHSLHSGDGPKRQKSLVRERMMNGGIGLSRQDSVVGNAPAKGMVNPAMEELMQLESELRGLTRIPTTGVGVETAMRSSPPGVEVEEEEDRAVTPKALPPTETPRMPPTPPDAGPRDLIDKLAPAPDANKPFRASVLSDTSVAEYGYAKPLDLDPVQVPHPVTPTGNHRAPTREDNQRPQTSNSSPHSAQLHAPLHHACDAIIRLVHRLTGQVDDESSSSSTKTYPSPQFYHRFATHAIPHHANVVREYVASYIADLEATHNGSRGRKNTGDSDDQIDAYMAERVNGIWKRVDVLEDVLGEWERGVVSGWGVGDLEGLERARRGVEGGLGQRLVEGVRGVRGVFS
ncbi:hypothetical protein HDV00_009316 [Rhizophlyctis rosea]|nr:hypothetical protein HDV00_009316 [Rhizophlyctis rosea]